MNNEIIDLARTQLKTIKRPFEWLYVNSKGGQYIATYVVTDEEKNIVFYKSVDAITRAPIDSGSTLGGPNHLAKQALEEHYNNDYIAQDALEQMFTVACEHGMYNHGTLPYHAVFGQNVYHADLEELRMLNDSYISLH